jgi:crossover junction endonuclease MUS81
MAECANPLLLSWVKEWLDTARERNSKGVTTYKKAYDSLKSCPLPFTHPTEVQQLTGFGPKLCSRLTDKLKDYCYENGLPMPEIPHKQRKKSKNNGGEDDSGEDIEPKKKARKPKPYVPALRSGAYALILALSTLDENASSGLTKAQTIELAQPHCDASFSAPADPNSFYTAWNSMKTLVTKDLVCEKGRPLRKYCLTDEGWDVAKRIKKSSDPNQGRLDTFVAAEKPPTARAKSNEDGFVELGSSPPRPTARQSTNSPKKPTSAFADIIPQGEVVSNVSALPTFTPIVLEPGSFTVELVLDVREIRAKTDRDYMQNNLLTSGVQPVMRALELGDILWVAKVRDPALLSRLGAEGDEVLLDYIIERKRLDDLVSSIKDGRFHEQKFRLRKSGIKNVIYIIEEISMNSDHFQKYEEAVQSAIAGTQVVEGYFIKKTQKMDDTIRYLVSMTKLLKQRYEKKPLHLIPTKVITTGNYMPLVEHLRKTKLSTEFHITYSAFASLSSKSETLTLRDVYLKMLMCTRGITGEKALEIQKRWKTPIEFVEAYKRIEEKEGKGEQGKKRKAELVSGEMGNLVGRKKIAKALSVKIAEVWGDV